MSNDQVLRRVLWSICRGWGMTKSDKWSISTTWRSTKKILFFRWLTLFNHEYNEVNFGFSQRLFKSAGIDQNHLGPGAMDFAVKFAQVLILSGPKFRLVQCKTWFKFKTWAFQEQKLYEFYQAVVPPERRERHRWKNLRICMALDINWYERKIWKKVLSKGSSDLQKWMNYWGFFERGITPPSPPPLLW